MKRILGHATAAAVVAAALLGATALSAGSAAAQGRQVVVNGVLLSPAQLQQLDYAAGSQVPNGNYWLDVNTGVWGYAGNPYPQGRIGAAPQAGAGAGAGAYNPQLYDGYNQGWWDNQARTGAAVGDFSQQAIMGLQTYVDPSTGQTYELPHDSNHYWADQQGNVYGTDTYTPPDNQTDYNALEPTE